MHLLKQKAMKCASTKLHTYFFSEHLVYCYSLPLVSTNGKLKNCKRALAKPKRILFAKSTAHY
ncbi:hypothetical protein DF947_20040 [Pedobacter paludis]|uniref:Uncharacterized protein n=1 Tax=Pedobacter paludis TaxID=2203212 RepID=A0A317ESG7_9SPHI|nr:hypothetical protein DF947_20040 [Pedobacter paludis]